MESDFLSQIKYRNEKRLLVDVGAHNGTFSLPFARKGWTVYAFEPERHNYKAYKKNLSGFKEVTCIPKAVSNISDQHVPFYVSNEHYGIHSLKPFHATHKFAYDVETISLNDAMVMQKVTAVTLLKIDIEGADYLALQGFDIAKYCPELVMIEFMDQRSEQFYGYTHHDVANYMQKRGYVTFVSEWAPFREYARKGVGGDPHIWIQCGRYPLKHEPCWGNLLFVPDNTAAQFEESLQRFVAMTKTTTPVKRGIGVRRCLSKVPGSHFIYNKIYDVRNHGYFKKK